MTQDLTHDEATARQVEVVWKKLPTWESEARALVELARNSERAAVHADPRTLKRAQDLLATVTHWRGMLNEWQEATWSDELRSKITALSAGLDRAGDEARAVLSALSDKH